jgi:hypothetical protein
LAHVAKSTCIQYARWVEQFLRFHRLPDGHWRSPAELRGPDAAFLTHMAVERGGRESDRLRGGTRNRSPCGRLSVVGIRAAGRCR